jgi:hypothetical protein
MPETVSLPETFFSYEHRYVHIAVLSELVSWYKCTVSSQSFSSFAAYLFVDQVCF